jgi:hypothetical protein
VPSICTSTGISSGDWMNKYFFRFGNKYYVFSFWTPKKRVNCKATKPITNLYLHTDSSIIASEGTEWW